MEEVVAKLEEIGEVTRNASLCGLGQTAPNPVLSTLRWFRHEYEAHIRDHKCPAHVCKGLIRYTIGPTCNGCTKCGRKCPVGAITGTVKQLHSIDYVKCIACGTCMEVCPFGAITVD